MGQRRPGIPDIAPEVPELIAGPLRALKEHAELSGGMRTSTDKNSFMRRSVTLGMLVKCGIMTEAQARRMFEEE